MWFYYINGIGHSLNELTYPMNKQNVKLALILSIFFCL